GSLAAALRRSRYPHQRRLARLRSGTESPPCFVPGVYLRRGQSRFPQRHHAPLRRGQRQAGLAADARLLRQPSQGEAGIILGAFAGRGKPRAFKIDPLGFLLLFASVLLRRAYLRAAFSVSICVMRTLRADSCAFSVPISLTWAFKTSRSSRSASRCA